MKERHTKQKEKLINYLKENSNKHLTIIEIYNDTMKEIGLTTIYRIINSEIKKGSMSKFPIPNKQGFCYQYNLKKESCKNHYHLVCENCNKILHTDSEWIKALVNKLEEKENFKINTSKVTFYGLCAKCQREIRIDEEKSF